MPLFAQTDSTETTDEEIDEDPIPWVKATNEGVYRLGVKMGIQYCTLLGTYPLDNKAMFGLLGGGYGRLNHKSGWSLQHELYISFRGGKFKENPPDVGTLKILYLDVPVILLKKFGAKSRHRAGAGMQYSHAINALMFQDRSTMPTGTNPSIDKNDWSVLLCYQYQFDYVALQLMPKYGLRNINLGYPWPGGDGISIPNKSGSMHNFAVEFNLLF